MVWFSYRLCTHIFLVSKEITANTLVRCPFAFYIYASIFCWRWQGQVGRSYATRLFFRASSTNTPCRILATTNIDCVLLQLGIRPLILVGVMTLFRNSSRCKSLTPLGLFFQNKLNSRTWDHTRSKGWRNQRVRRYWIASLRLYFRLRS